MNIIRYFVYLVLAVFPVIASPQQTVSVEVPAVDLKSDVAGAIYAAGVANSEDWEVAFEKIYEDPNFVTGINSTLGSQERVQVIARYISAKSAFDDGEDLVNLDDFSWDYVANDIEFVPIVLDGSEPAKLVSAEVGEMKYVYPASTQFFQPGDSILIPTSVEPGSTAAMAEFSLAGGQAAWNGFANWSENQLQTLRLDTAFDDNSCLLSVSSDPPGATIYINDVEFYKKTNIRFAQPADSIELRIELDGYEPWVATRDLVEGEGWLVNPKLEPSDN